MSVLRFTPITVSVISVFAFELRMSEEPGGTQMNLRIELKKHNRRKMLLMVRGRLLCPNESVPLEPVELGSRQRCLSVILTLHEVW
ncbi:hypothetical protein BKA83DRAFT_2213396 [Pisolithus microcarpus]|nr:hypothetical protein BKA83DRAFT_2213396 [Pisolithus microcarpus]